MLPRELIKMQQQKPNKSLEGQKKQDMQLSYWLFSYKICPYKYILTLRLTAMKFDQTIHVSEEFVKTSS